jgi:hypothetical protein
MNKDCWFLFLVLCTIITIVHAQKYYTVTQITSELNLNGKSCLISVTETITFNFNGDYTQFARSIVDSNAYRKINIPSSSLVVQSLTPGVTVTSYTVKRNIENDASFIITNFKGPAGGGLWTFKYNYEVDGPLANDDGDTGTDNIYWSYKFNTPIDNVDLSISFPFAISNSTLQVSPASDVVSKTSNNVRVRRQAIPSNIAYEVFAKYPHPLGTKVCSRPTTHSMDIVLIIVLVSVFVPLCLCLTIICSIWGAIRRGLIWGDRFGYVPYGTATYYTTGYHPHHHHHHHSGGGSSYQSSGISGTSGFAN